MDSVFGDLPTCWNLFVISKSILWALLRPFADAQRVAGHWVTWSPCSQGTWPMWPSAAFSFYKINKYPFLNIFNATFFTPLCFWLVILLLGMVPKATANIILPKRKEAAMCLMEKMRVLDTFVQSRVTVLLAVSWTLMNQQHRLNKVSFNRNQVMYWSVDENVATRCLEKPNALFPPGAGVQYLLINVCSDFIEYKNYESWESIVRVCVCVSQWDRYIDR